MSKLKDDLAAIEHQRWAVNKARIDEAAKALHIMTSREYGDLLKRDTLDQVIAQNKRIKYLEKSKKDKK